MADLLLQEYKETAVYTPNSSTKEEGHPECVQGIVL